MCAWYPDFFVMKSKKKKDSPIRLKLNLLTVQLGACYDIIDRR